MRSTLAAPSALVLIYATAACAVAAAGVKHTQPAPAIRASAIARSQVWNATDVRAKNLRVGPEGPGAFAPGETVSCTWVPKKLGGHSPKFACRIGDDDVVKVKYGADNGEVYGEVLATRLLWALGFGADRMYPVSVLCRGCPKAIGGVERADGVRRIDPAAIERKMDGTEWRPGDRGGWSWPELDRVDPAAGGAPRAQVDALKLLAVFFQHTDSKPDQQRIVCTGEKVPKSSEECPHPFLMINDVGLTFGHANRFNTNNAGSVNLVAWRQTPVWKHETGCTGNLPKSLTGTLDDPAISEQGRQFLADLLVQVSDAQIRDLFEVARVTLRLREPGHASSGQATVDDWLDAFKEKRRQILERRCTPGALHSPSASFLQAIDEPARAQPSRRPQ